MKSLLTALLCFSALGIAQQKLPPAPEWPKSTATDSVRSTGQQTAPVSPEQSKTATPGYPSRDEALLALDVVDKAFAAYESILTRYTDVNGRNLVQQIGGEKSFEADGITVKTGRQIIGKLRRNPSKVRSYSLVVVLSAADDVTLNASKTVMTAAMRTCVQDSSAAANLSLLTAMTSSTQELRDASETLMHVTLRQIAADEALIAQATALKRAGNTER